ncbi:putative membrane protein [Pseudomonas nitroreducens]|nr:putative membrane protein [Pseudomonas nitroreducens]MCP1689436.1 putative membrane protein [Pseudomonas nitroreducens]
MKSATPDRQSLNAGTISWLLAQTFWVGGLWLLQFVVLPALGKIGLAPLLVETVADVLRPLLLAFAGFCVLLQALVLWQARGFAALIRETRGQLLLTVLVMAAVYVVVQQIAPDAQRWLLFNYLVVALCGLLLVLQPAPGRDERA